MAILPDSNRTRKDFEGYSSTVRLMMALMLRMLSAGIQADKTS